MRNRDNPHCAHDIALAAFAVLKKGAAKVNMGYGIMPTDIGECSHTTCKPALCTAALRDVVGRACPCDRLLPKRSAGRA